MERVTTAESLSISRVENAKYKIALMDFGEKRNMTLCLNARGCDVTVLPAHTPASRGALPDGYDGVMLSNGPGDPADNAGDHRRGRRSSMRQTCPSSPSASGTS